MNHYVTCPNSACGNYDIPIPVDPYWYDDDGNPHQYEQIFCGPCGTDITGTLVEGS